MVVQCVVAQNFEYGGLNYTVTDTKEWTVTLTGPVDKSITTLDVPAKVPYTRETADKGTETIFCTVTAIGRLAFYNSTTLKDVTIADNVKTIGDQAFSGCSALSTISFSKNLTTIGNTAFGSCSNLESIELPPTVKTIEQAAFSGCTILRNLKLNEGLESIGKHAFNSDQSLLQITIPSTVNLIDEYAFAYCNTLRKVTFAGGVKNINYRAFYNCSSIREVHGKDAASWSTMNFYDYSANPISVSHNLYLGGELVTDLVIPASVEEVGTYAYYALQSLKTIKFEDGVKKIGNYAFAYTTELESIDCGNTLEHFDTRAFEGSGIKELNLSNSVRILGNSAFESCKRLEKINWSTGMEIVGEGAFSYCETLKTVNISDLSAWCRVEFRSDSNPLNYAHKMTLNGEEIIDLVIPDDITQILNYAFNGGADFKTIKISDSVTRIGFNSFTGCRKLESLHIGTGLKLFELSPFDYCTQIKKIHIADGSQNLTIVGNASIWGTPEKINDLYIGRNYTVSGTFAPNVQLLTFGPKVTNAEANDYTKYNSLLMITDLSATPPALYEFTEEQYAKVAVKVPEGATDAYKAADYWKNFALITESSDYDVENIKISFNADSYNIFPKAFQASDLAYTITPEVFQPLGVEYTSSDPSILTFDGLTPQPVRYGNVTLTARIPMTGATATAEATVYVAPTAVSLTCGETLTMKVGDTYQFVAETEPGPVVPEMLTWKSYYTSRLTIDKNGLATALKTGKNISVQVKTFNGKTYKTTVNIVEASGIDDVEAIEADSVCDVYNLNGILLRKDATASDRDALPRGIYILRSGDKTIKFIK